MTMMKTTHEASSSIYSGTYQVFLSFKGEDTRKNFTDHLYTALSREGIQAFRDDEIQRGKEIDSSIKRAIHNSKMSVIVFSEKYASSIWCLDELVIIMEHKKITGDHAVLPVFYKVDPSDVLVHGDCSADDKEKVDNWRAALAEVKNLAGMVLNDRPEAQFIQDIVNEVRSLIGDNSISALRPYEPCKQIKVRICRIWKTKNTRSHDQISTLNCILVDAKGHAIQATTEARDCDFFYALLVPGATYDINDFYIKENKSSNAVVPHSAMLEFSRKTIIIRSENACPGIPRHGFCLVDYQNLLREENKLALADVLGCLIAMQPIESVLTKYGRFEDKRDFFIKNLRKEQVRVTLWGEAARNFDQGAIEALTPPVIIVFTSLKLKKIQGVVLSNTDATLHFLNPEISELPLYKTAFATTTVQLWTPSPFRKWKTIKDLLLKPNTNIREFFSCWAKIINFDLAGGWWYNACPTCFRKLKYISSNLSCLRHGVIDKAPLPWYKLNCVVEDETSKTNFLMFGEVAENFLGVSCHSLVVEQGYHTRSVLPPIIRKMIGSTKIFQINFGKLSNGMSKPDLIVSKMFDDHPPIISSVKKRAISIEDEAREHDSNIEVRERHDPAVDKEGASINGISENAELAIDSKTVALSSLKRKASFKKPKV